MSIPSLCDLTAADVANGLDQNLFDSVQLVEAYTQRIKEVDGLFHTTIEVNPDAVSIAASLDEERKQTGRRGYRS